MAQVALILCLGFIAFAIRQDTKECRETSKSLWIPFIWLATCASKPLTLWLYPSLSYIEAKESASIQGTPTERAFLLILLSAGILTLYKRRHSFSLYFRDNVFVLIFYFYVFISCGWSDYQGASIRKWIRMVGDAIMVLIILTERNREEAIEHVFRRCSIVLIPLSVIFIRYFTQIGINYTYDGTRTWTGVTTHKNTLGVLCAFTGILLIWRIIKRWPKRNAIDMFLLLLCLYLLYGSKSATSAIILILGTVFLTMGFYVKEDVKKLSRFAILTLLSVVIIQLLSISLINSSIGSVFISLTDRDSTLTGRIPIWQEVMKIGIQKPIFGAGYGSFWITNLRYMWAKFNFHPNNAHNGYIDIFLDLGVLGLAALLLLIVKAYKNTIRLCKENAKLGYLLLTLFVMVLFHNFTESSLAKGFNLLWFIFLLSSIVVTKKSGLSKAENSTGLAVSS